MANHPRKGAVVKTFSTTDIGNYFEARTMIECFVAHLAVQNVDKFPESVKKMQEAADQLERVHVEQMDVEQIRKWETQFHSELIKLSDNPQLERLYEFNWSVGSVYFVYSIKKVSPDNFRVSLREHQKILGSPFEPGCGAAGISGAGSLAFSESGSQLVQLTAYSLLSSIEKSPCRRQGDFMNVPERKCVPARFFAVRLSSPETRWD